MADIAILFKIDEKAQRFLEESQVSFSVFQGDSSLEEWMVEQLKEAKVAILFPGQKFGERDFKNATKLKLLIVHGSGLDAVDMGAASKYRVCVANAPDAIAEAVAEHALALVMSSLRNIVHGDSIIRNGKWVRGIQRSLVGRSLKTLSVGVIGLGRIGSEVARIFSALGNSVSYWDRKRKPEIEHALKVEYKDLKDLLATSDIIVVSIALAENTRKLLGPAEISMIKKGALLVNISRGAIVDEKSLIERLKTGEISAALDVFEEEPISIDNPLIQFKNVVMTPHIAGFTEEALRETSIFVVKSAIEFIKKGKLPYTTVNTNACL
ncbi:MAG: 2-hydroxyacid dehydrogenase [Fervidicoccaceae archaeon]